MPTFIDPNTLQAYNYDPVTGRTTPLGPAGPQSSNITGPPAYGTRGYVGVQGPVGSPSGPAASILSGGYVSQDGSYVPPQAIPGVNPSSTVAPVVASTTGNVIPPTQSAPAPAPAGPVDRHDPVAAQARIYRINHGLATADDSAATDALNAESLAAERSGRTYLDRNLAAQYGQTPPAGTVGPRTDVVNALLMPPTSTGTAYAQRQSPYQSPASQQPIVLAPTTTQPTQMQANTLLQQGIY